MSFLEQQLETSNARERIPRRKFTSAAPIPRQPALAPTTTTDVRPPAPHEWSLGNMSDGSLNANHPLVARYVERTARALEAAEAEHAATPENGGWHVKTGHYVSWWMAEMAGVVKAGDSWDACRIHVEQMLEARPGEYNLVTVKAIFVLGALSTFAFPGNVPFWAFWSKNAFETTASLVDEVVKLQPPLVTVPKTASWPDKALSMAAVDVYRRGWLPVIPRPIERRVSGRERKIKALPGAKASASKKRKAAAVPQPKTVEDVPMALDEDTDVDIDVVTVDEPPRPQSSPTLPAKRSLSESSPNATDADRIRPSMSAWQPTGPAAGYFAVSGPTIQVRPGVVLAYHPAPEPIRDVSATLHPKSTAMPVAANPLMALAEIALQDAATSGAVGSQLSPTLSPTFASASTVSTVSAAPSPEGTLVGTATPSDNLTRFHSPQGVPKGQSGVELAKVNAKLVKSAVPHVRSSVRIRELAAAKARKTQGQ